MTAATTPVPAGTVIGEILNGLLFGRTMLADGVGAEAMGDVTTNPDPFKLLGRLKAIATALVPLATVAKQDAIILLIDGLETALDALNAKHPTLGAKASSGSVSMTPATDATFATDGAASTNAFAIVPHASNALATVPRGIYVGVTGDVILKTAGNTDDITFKAVPAGSILPVRATHVRATSTAASMIGLA